ncbi:MAG: hypothetical protein LQ346_007989 [Caloplaca aetnensis]|nr:MAG: hypothetical protein LQ346_007989 [Caloplaca aetnensis]
MSILRFMVVSFLAMLASGLPADLKKAPASTKPGLVKIFDGKIDLGDFSPPIPIPGGQRIVAKVNGGTLTGKFNADIQAGISVIDLVDNGQAIVNNVRSFGTTTDGQPFLIDESGLGSADDDFARIILSVGGSYTGLANSFLFTEATLSSDRKTVSTTAYQTVDR